MASKLWRALPLLCLMLASCGGGGGSSGGDENGENASLRLSATTLTVTAAQAEEFVSDTSLSILLSDLPDEGVFVAVDHTDAGIQNASFFQTSDTQATLEVFFKAPGSLAVGSYRDTVEVIACYDEACTRRVSGSPVNVQVTYVVEPTPTMTLDRTERRLVASLGQDAPALTTIDVTFDSVPTRGIFVTAITTGRARPSAQVIEVTPRNRRVQVSLPDPDDIGVGNYSGTVIVVACLRDQAPCPVRANQGEQSVPFVYRVAADPIAATRVLDLGAQDLVYDPISRLLYTVQPATTPYVPNALLAINPVNGAVIGAAPTGYDPRLLAVSDDGSKFYVGLPSTNQVQRFAVPSFVPDLLITLPQNVPGETGQVQQIDVAPGAAGTLAVSRYSDVFIYDEGIRRPAVFGDDEFANADTVEWGATASSLFSSDTTVSGQDVDLYRLGVTASGAAIQSTYVDAMDRGPRIHFAQDRIYSDAGRVIDATTGAVVGTLVPGQTPSFGPRVAIDTGRRLAYMAVRRPSDLTGTLRVEIFNLDTLARIRSFEVPGSVTTGPLPLEPRRIERWGEDGLALLNSSGQVLLVQGPLVSDGPP